MNLGDAFDHLQREEQGSPGLTDEQQIIRLQEFFAQVYEHEPERFEPGQIIWQKNPSLSTTKICGHPTAFIEYLDKPVFGTDVIRDPSDLRAIGSGCRCDCRIGIIWQGCFCVYLMDSREYSSTKPRTAE